MNELKLLYCGKRLGNRKATCASLAKYKRLYISTKSGSKCYDWRCEQHKFSNQKNKEDMVHEEIDQTEDLNKVNAYLRTFIGNPVYSKIHSVKRPFIGMYLKDNGGMMCQNEHTKRWYFIYYNQIGER